jgi:hypothetical protein
MTDNLTTPDPVLEAKRQDLLEMLRKGVCEVTFTKLDGETRTMPCTLAPELLPPAPEPQVLAEGETVLLERKANPKVMSVWCTDKKEWRSFRVMNVTSITAV